MNASNSFENSAVKIAALTKFVNGSKLIALDQRTEEWHDWRNGKDLPDGKPRITGTASGIIYGNNPYKTMHGLWRELMGLSEPEAVNFVMQRGIDLEDPARELYMVYTGNSMEPVCVEHPKHGWAGASLDGLDPDAEIIIEIKCVGRNTQSYAERGVLPDHYVPQVQWQLLCTPSAKMVHYWSVDAAEVQSLLRAGCTIERDAEKLLAHCQLVIVKPDPILQAKLLQICAEFRQCLISGTPPAGNAWLDAARTYVLAKQACEEADAALKDAERLLLEEVPVDQRNVDGARVEGGGVSVTYYEASGSVDYGKLLKDLNVPEDTVEKYRKTGSIRKRITLTGEVPAPVPEVILAMPTEVTTSNATRGLDQW